MAYPKDNNETTVGELMHGITHSENYHMMAMKFGHFEFNSGGAPVSQTINVYPSRFKKDSNGELCKTYDKVKKRSAVITEAGPTITIPIADLTAAGGTAGDLKTLIGAAAQKAGEDWADHFYVGTMDQDLLREEFDDSPVCGSQFCTIPGLRNVEIINPWIGVETELSPAELAAPVSDYDIDTMSSLTILSEFMLNQRPVEVVMYLDQDADDEEEEEDDEDDDE